MDERAAYRYAFPMDYSRAAQRLNSAMIATDNAWSDLDIWPEPGTSEMGAAHVLFSSVLAVVGDDPVDFASWSYLDGALVATLWTSDLVAQGSRDSDSAALSVTFVPRATLTSIRIHTPPALSLPGYGVHVGTHVVEAVYPKFSATFKTRSEETFISAVQSFRDDLL